MQASMRLVRIFIGSPGGLEEERKAAREVFDEVNLAHGEQWGLHFKIVAWEDTVPGYQRAQSKINEDLDRCEYFIGVLHDRWGTPPSNDPNGYSSGFEEEFYRAEKALKSGKMKDMALFFKNIAIKEGLLPGPEIQKVLEFREEQVGGKVNYFRNFSTLDEFRGHVRIKLNEIGWKESGFLALKSEGEASQPDPKGQNDLIAADEIETGLFDIEARNFLSELLNKPQDWNATEASEAARLRLIAASVSRPGNDQVSVGAHDANLIFKHFRDEKLSEQEYKTLIESGVSGFDYCNVPLWRWLSRKEEHEPFPNYHLRLLATAGTEGEQRNAIRILQSIGETIPTHDGHFNTHGVLESWFSEVTKDGVFEAAVKFLAENGEVGDLQAIEEAQRNAPDNRKKKIESAIVKILSKQSSEAALKHVCEREVERVDASTLASLFSSPQSLSTATLAKCLSAKLEEVRLRSAELLHERKEISFDTANTLLTDSNHDIRLIAVEALRYLGAPLDDGVIKKVLTIEKGSQGLLALSPSVTDTSVYDSYLRDRLFELSEAELRLKMEGAGLSLHRETEVLFKKYRSKPRVLAEIRTNLADGFEDFFESHLKVLEVKVGKSNGLVDEARKQSDYYRKLLCDSALPALCSKLKREDLNLVRQTLDTLPIKVDKDILNYLYRFGDWADIERINKLANGQTKMANLLDFGRTDLASERAIAILRIGKHRLADLLDSNLQYSIRNEVLNQMSCKSLGDMSDDLILRELRNESDQSRIIFALRCVQCLPKARINALLDHYVDGDQQRFYNSIHWLDLGASFPTKVARCIAQRELLRRQS